jgi:hypothetical protein
MRGSGAMGFLSIGLTRTKALCTPAHTFLFLIFFDFLYYKKGVIKAEEKSCAGERSRFTHTASSLDKPDISYMQIINGTALIEIEQIVVYKQLFRYFLFFLFISCKFSC